MRGSKEFKSIPRMFTDVTPFLTWHAHNPNDKHSLQYDINHDHNEKQKKTSSDTKNV